MNSIVLKTIGSFVIIALSVTLALAQGRSFTEYSKLSAKQRDLIEKWAASTGTKGSTKFDAMTVSQHSTFEAVTNALTRSRLTSKSGRASGYAIDLVSAIEFVAGQEEGKGSDEQFRMYVKLVPNAIERLEDSREFSRGKDNTIFHHGYPINYRQTGKPPTMQFSIAPDKTRADIDVDYRSSGFPAALFNGHLTAGNSDVRVKWNYSTHTSRWFGLIDWWDKDVQDVLSKLIGGNSAAPTPAYVPVSANGDLPDAAGVEARADQFFSTWLLKRDVNSAAGFFSSQLAACATSSDKKAERDYRQRRRVLIYTMLKAVNKELGKIDRIEQGISALRPLYSSILPLDHRLKGAYTLAHVPESYYQHFVCDGTTLNWSGGESVRDRSYGKYYVTMFKLDLKSGLGGGLKLFWINEAGIWKIVTFEIVSS